MADGNAARWQATGAGDTSVDMTAAVMLAVASLSEEIVEVIISRVARDDVELAEGLAIGSPLGWFGYGVHDSGFRI